MDTNLNLPDPLAEWLHRLNDNKTPSPAGILINHGVQATSAELAPPTLMGPARECYTNTMRTLITLLPLGDDWKYCEGYAYKPKWPGPIEHAWLINGRGHVWETTWTDIESATYLGLTFEAMDIADALGESDQSMLFGDWSRDFQLLESHRQCCPGRRASTTRAEVRL